jgi:hypothetical protein
VSPDRSQRLPAIDALARGVANVRANSELLIVQVVSMLFIVASIAVPAVYLLQKIGIPPSLLLENDPRKVQEGIAGIDFDPAALVGLVGAGLLFLLVGGTVLFIFYCFAQAGTLAVLSAGDAQAPTVRSAPVEVFRAFSWRAYFSWCFRFGWRLFWLYNLVLLVMSLVLLLLLVPLLVAGRSFDEANVPATCLLACGLSIPVFAVFFVLAIATQVSSAVVVVDDAGAVRAMRRGLSLTGRRLGGLLLLLVLFFCASMAIGTAAFAAEFALGLILREASALRFTILAAVEMLKFLLSTVLGLILSSALIALVRGESRSDAPAAGPSAA